MLYDFLTSEDIWNRDTENINLAKDKGFYVIILWEKDIKSKSNEELIKLLLDKFSKMGDK